MGAGGRESWADKPRKKSASAPERPFSKGKEPLKEKIAVVTVINEEGERTTKTLRPGKTEEIEIESGKLEIISTEKVKIKINIED